VGFHLSQRLLRDGRESSAWTALNNYYDRH
jgi:hypothetical protein